MTDQATFQPSNSYATARRYADADLKNRVSRDELAWLQNNRLLWLRALTAMRRDVENHIAKDRLDTNAKKPLPGGHTAAIQEAWLRTKSRLDARTKDRLHFVEKVKTRMEEVKALIGPTSAVDRMLVGDAIADMLDIAQLAQEGDLRAVQDKARHVAWKWTDKYSDTTPSA